ncbi:hypothetical protein EDE08_109286 [Bradyrhizobium sp. R2.2-H]|jgi:hypothetical protein|nr:hypothetical protein EDE10_109127 [Bradyrhizobium sp. Y-H1]TCU70065.1 hypothetical protein EDE08_109286 [Bradyrhizobium sp. R2.2-H]
MTFMCRLIERAKRGLPEFALGLGEGTSLKRLTSLNLRGWLLVGTAVCGVALAGAIATFGSSARAGNTLEERKLPMKFSWVACEPNCRGWVSAVGIITADTPREFEEFSRGRQLGGATVVLDSSGGSVNDAITLGRRFRNLGLLTTVGVSLRGGPSTRPAVAPEAYCESMCVFLLLAGKKRYVPEAAHVRVHQIWMGDRADDAKAASYSAQDLMIVERDIGRLAKYTFDMGGAGDLLSLALSVPPWEDLHELDAGELKLTNLVTTDLVADVLPHVDISAPAMAELAPKTQARFGAEPEQAQPAKSTKTAEALVPTGGVAAPAAATQK